MHLRPTSVCISKAKSSAVALLGRVLKSPAGVNTYISPTNRFSLKSSIKSMVLVSGFSNSSLIFFIHSSNELSLPPDCLYLQCAAYPFSAISSIRLLLICTSTHFPPSPITVV